ncbi:MAG TPA: MFS transporter, partial [Vicinamibacteria bacterium]|nr:MFS transporter [Vicinamibacteria bacterium]
MLAGLSIAETISWGIVYYTFSVFIRPMEMELGWSRAQVSGAFSLALLVGGIAAVPVGHWLDAHGPRALMTAGSMAAVVLLLAWSRVESLVAFYLVWAGLGLAMAAILYEPAFAIVAAWFVRHRHRALTILTVCAGLASTIFVPLAGWLLVRLGWRSAIATLAAILALTTIPIHALLLRRSPQAVGAGVDGDERDPLAPARAAPATPSTTALREALGRRAFWILTAAVVLSGLAAVATVVHLIPFLLGRGIPLATAAFAAGGVGLMQLPGRLFYAPIRRRLSIFGSTATVLLVQALALAWLPMVRGRTGLAVFVIAFGMGNGAATLVRATGIAELFEPEVYARIGGMMAFFTAVARASGPIAAALAYQRLGSYGAVFWSLSALLAIGAA